LPSSIPIVYAEMLNQTKKPSTVVHSYGTMYRSPAVHAYAAPDQFNIAEPGHVNTFVPESMVAPAQELVDACGSTGVSYEENGCLVSTAHREHNQPYQSHC